MSLRDLYYPDPNLDFVNVTALRLSYDDGTEIRIDDGGHPINGGDVDKLMRTAGASSAQGRYTPIDFTSNASYDYYQNNWTGGDY